jgi:uncharacterized protein involved in type VI secretion and phage assembly
MMDMPQTSAMTGYFGKYRGLVANNIDPSSKGRLQVSVPAVYGSNTMNWALPCTPYAGPQQGFYFIPPVGANIWVEFEGGNLNAPIWSGCFWGDGECPGGLAGDRITITAQGIRLESASGATVELSGPQVSINNGALEVM